MKMLGILVQAVVVSLQHCGTHRLSSAGCGVHCKCKFKLDLKVLFLNDPAPNPYSCIEY